MRLAFSMLVAGVIASSLLVRPHSLAAQSSDDPAVVLPADEKTPEPPEKVEVQPVARDEEISGRLQDILTEIMDKTDRFTDVGVSVKDGVVFLSGEATQEDYRAWAGDLARNTQDVVAVVNRMTIRESSIWDMSPAIAELNGVWRNAVQMIPFFIFGIVTLLLTWFFAKLAVRWTAWGAKGYIKNPLLRNITSKAAAIPVFNFGLVCGPSSL